METEQRGYRGVAIESVTNPRLEQPAAVANRIPEPLPPPGEGSPPASMIFENVKVLGDVESARFARLMSAITAWVSPEQGCTYCHAGGNFATEGPYTKHVARRMIQMTMEINREWKSHVGETGVTCYTCHRGMPVPANYWVAGVGDGGGQGIVGGKAGQNAPASQVGLTSLPADPFSPFLLESRDIRVQSSTALPASNRRSIKQAEWTYGFMMHISTSLGVNCTYCHNSRALRSWEASSPPRVTAWNGIRMARHLNQTYLEPLADVFPAHRKGPQGDVFKLSCATCHQGIAKPLMGVSMLEDYPSLADTMHAEEATRLAAAIAPESAPQSTPDSAPESGGRSAVD